MTTQADLAVPILGAARFESPLTAKGRSFSDPALRVRLEARVGPGHGDRDGLLLEKGGPRERIFFDPAETTAAFVTCGGLAPGLNNTIRSGFLELRHNYGVQRILGIREGYRGLDPHEGLEPIVLTPASVDDINDMGGTVLGTSRGGRDPVDMVDYLEAHDIDILFAIGGDGTQRGAHAVAEEARKRGSARAIVGIPKTIDNDVPFVYQSFGYMTALEGAAQVLRQAHVEAKSHHNGIGLVKLMGRDAGFITAGAAVAAQEANFVLVPEVPFPLDAPGGFLDALEARLLTRHHAVIAVAEGAGQHLFELGEGSTDESGNRRYWDIGPFLCDRIRQRLRESDIRHTIKYFDPSYSIRSVPPNANDRFLTDRMARNAVHAAMAGKTDVMVGVWNQSTVWVPIAAAVAERKRMDPAGDLWGAVLATTGQPNWMADEQA